MDSRITRWIASARQSAEKYLARALCPQTLEIALDAFPADIELLWPPLIEIVSVVYVDGDGNDQTLGSNLYTTDTHQEPSWLIPADGTSWPSTKEVANAVRVRYEAGYSIHGDSPQTHPLPVPIESALLLAVEYLYEGGSEEALEGFMGRCGMQMWRLERGFA